MGCVYRLSEHHCKTCRRRLGRTAERVACTAAGHIVEKRKAKGYMIGYRRAGRSYAEPGGKRLGDATLLLHKREGKIADGVPITPAVGKLAFEAAAADLLNDYTTNGKRSLAVVERRVTKHLTPYFEGRRMADISTLDVRAFIAHRQEQGVVHHRTKERIGEVSNAEINRELALLKRMFSLAVQAGQLFHRPHVPMLRESAARSGFFEPNSSPACSAISRPRFNR